MASVQRKVFTCPICFGYSFDKRSRLVEHIRLIHSDTPNFFIRCWLQNCNRTFNKFSTWRNHVYTFHQNCDIGDDSPSNVILHNETQGTEDHESQDLLDESNSEARDTVGTNVPPVSVHRHISWNDIEKASARWILKAREVNRLPLSVVDELIEDTQSLYTLALSYSRDCVVETLTKADIESSVIEEVVAKLSDSSFNMFCNLKTQSQQTRFFLDHFNLIQPEEICLGTIQKRRGTGRKSRIVTINETMVYIPILKTLEALLNNETVLTEINRGHQRTDGVLSDFCDGLYCKSQPFFANNKALQLLPYYDDVEVCNPLGSSRTKHKLGLFYFNIGNLHPMFRSKLSAVNLIAICRTKFIKKYSLNEVWKPFIEDVKKLEQGVTMTIEGRSQLVYGSVALLSADNLASCASGGFKEGGTAYRFCRQCLTTEEKSKQMFEEDQFELRNLTTHLAHLTELDEASNEQRSQISKKYGINCRSIFMDLQHFDICQCLIPDVMHDILEGTLQYELKLCLQYLIETAKYFSLDQLNDAIESMEMGYMEASDRPAPISRSTLNSKGHSLKQKAIQAWALCRLVPFMIGKFIPHGEVHWENFLTLLLITGYLMAPEITEDEVDYLKVLIEEHHRQFKLIYPDASITPKLHYMIHMASFIKKFGPLVRFWTMRFEAKHSYFKNLSQHIGNYKNLSLTLSKRHQFLNCYNRLGSQLHHSDMEIGPGSVVGGIDIPSDLHNVQECFRPNWVVLNGIKYQSGAVILVNVENDFPEFAQIVNIFIVNNDKAFVYTQMMNTLSFELHFNSYHVVKANNRIFDLQAINLKHPQLYTLRLLYLSDTTMMMIVPKFHINGTAY